MITIDRYIMKKGNEYVLLEKNINPNLYKFSQLKGKNADLYRKSILVYVDPNKKELVDAEDFRGLYYVNTRNMNCDEFLNSEFFKTNEAEIILTMSTIARNNRKSKDKVLDLRDKSCYKILNSTEFLTSDFARNHYEEIYNTIDQIALEKERQNTNSMKKELKNK